MFVLVQCVPEHIMPARQSSAAAITPVPRTLLYPVAASANPPPLAVKAKQHTDPDACSSINSGKGASSVTASFESACNECRNHAALQDQNTSFSHVYCARYAVICKQENPE
jgi:hypothetical protein